jgi:uncharacterized protein (TIGR02246 family)
MNDTDSIRETIEQHNANVVRWYAEGKIDLVAGVFTEDAWQMPPNSPPLVGREAIRKFWSDAVKSGKVEFTFDTEDIQVSGNMAIERGKYIVKVTANENAPPQIKSFEDRGNYLVHWQREDDGEWRIAADAPVSELPLQSGSDENT